MARLCLWSSDKKRKPCSSEEFDDAVDVEDERNATPEGNQVAAAPAGGSTAAAAAPSQEATSPTSQEVPLSSTDSERSTKDGGEFDDDNEATPQQKRGVVSAVERAAAAAAKAYSEARSPDARTTRGRTARASHRGRDAAPAEPWCDEDAFAEEERAPPARPVRSARKTATHHAPPATVRPKRKAAAGGHDEPPAKRAKGSDPKKPSSAQEKKKKACAKSKATTSNAPTAKGGGTGPKEDPKRPELLELGQRLVGKAVRKPGSAFEEEEGLEPGSLDEWYFGTITKCRTQVNAWPFCVLVVWADDDTEETMTVDEAKGYVIEEAPDKKTAGKKTKTKTKKKQLKKK